MYGNMIRKDATRVDGGSFFRVLYETAKIQGQLPTLKRVFGLGCMMRLLRVEEEEDLFEPLVRVAVCNIIVQIDRFHSRNHSENHKNESVNVLDRLPSIGEELEIGEMMVLKNILSEGGLEILFCPEEKATENDDRQLSMMYYIDRHGRMVFTTVPCNSGGQQQLQQEQLEHDILTETDITGKAPEVEVDVVEEEKLRVVGERLQNRLFKLREDNKEIMRVIRNLVAKRDVVQMHTAEGKLLLQKERETYKLMNEERVKLMDAVVLVQSSIDMHKEQVMALRQCNASVVAELADLQRENLLLLEDRDMINLQIKKQHDDVEQERATIAAKRASLAKEKEDLANEEEDLKKKMWSASKDAAAAKKAHVAELNRLDARASKMSRDVEARRGAIRSMEAEKAALQEQERLLLEEAAVKLASRLALQKADNEHKAHEIETLNLDNEHKAQAIVDLNLEKDRKERDLEVLAKDVAKAHEACDKASKDAKLVEWERARVNHVCVTLLQDTEKQRVLYRGLVASHGQLLSLKMQTETAIAALKADVEKLSGEVSVRTMEAMELRNQLYELRCSSMNTAMDHSFATAVFASPDAV